MSIANCSYSIAGLLGSELLRMYGVSAQNFEGLKDLVVLRSIGLAIPLLFLFLVPDTTSILAPGEECDEDVSPLDQDHDDESTIGDEGKSTLPSSPQQTLKFGKRERDGDETEVEGDQVTLKMPRREEEQEKEEREQASIRDEKGESAV
jgi:hypothetical protein